MNDEYKRRDRALEQALELVRLNSGQRGQQTKADVVITMAKTFLKFLQEPLAVSTNVPLNPATDPWSGEGPFDPPMGGGHLHHSDFDGPHGEDPGHPSYMDLRGDVQN
jgi:hypothetical protein